MRKLEPEPAARDDVVAFLATELPYHVHARLLASFVATALGDDVDARRTFASAAATARQLLLGAGYATDADVLDPRWDEIFLDAARERFRAARG